MDVIQWYKLGHIECELYRDETILWRLTDGEYEFNKRESIAKWDLPAPTFDTEEERLVWEKLKAEGNATPKQQPKSDSDIPDDKGMDMQQGWDVYYEDFVATEYSDVAILFYGTWRVCASTHALEYLDGDSRASIEKLTEPLKPDYAAIFSGKLPQSKLLDAVKNNVICYNLATETMTNCCFEDLYTTRYKYGFQNRTEC